VDSPGPTYFQNLRDTGSSTSIYGSTDYAGNPRINGSGQINIGAYEK
jgi:hypothetical protein